MFSLKIVDSDAFLDMPQSTQLLYFHLSMRADDDGFVGNPKKIARVTGASDDDMKVLLAKRFLLSFESGVVVIKHWKIHNYIQTDRYQQTQYIDEKLGLEIKENGAYTECIQNVSKMDTQVRLGKVRLGKVRLGESEETKTPTPRMEAEQFFKEVEQLQNGDTNTLGEWLAEKAETTGMGKALIWQEIQKFTAYWTERTKNGKQARWETEKTWEWRRRFATWISRAVGNNNFTNGTQAKKQILI